MEDSNILLISVALISVTLIICITIASNALLKGMRLYLNKKDTWNSLDINIEKYYALFIRSIEEHKGHFSDFRLSDYEVITDNEVTPDEYTELKREYIKEYIEKHGKSMMFNIITTHVYSDIQNLTSFLSKDFDIYFKNEYAIIKANKEG